MKVQDLDSFKQKALQWANTFDVCCCYDSNSYPDTYGKFDFLLAVGAKDSINLKYGDAFDTLRNFYDIHKTWMFGLLSYDLKNEVEKLSSANADGLNFPDLFFFIPQYLIAVVDGKIQIIFGEETLLERIELINVGATESHSTIKVQCKISRELYIQTVEELKEHIARGDIYEVNFCQEFFAEHAHIDPLNIYNKLKTVSPTPFSGFFKINDQYILSASPERFLCKRENKLITQPIKGTAKRSNDIKEDELIKLNLQNDAKEQAENVMIVDLVRNDLTKSAVKGSVIVEELFGIYGFAQVYQMISTVSCQLNPEVHFIDAIRNAFPMGSMTGAPKIKAMELIENYEFSRRGAYSGTFGYITPEGDFDFNVIIRSILYQSSSNYLSFQVGGAITYASNASSEYEECMLKASAIIQTLEN